MDHRAVPYMSHKCPVLNQNEYQVSNFQVCFNRNIQSIILLNTLIRSFYFLTTSGPNMFLSTSNPPSLINPIFSFQTALFI